MPFRDAEKRRAYQRERERARRADPVLREAIREAQRRSYHKRREDLLPQMRERVKAMRLENPDRVRSRAMDYYSMTIEKRRTERREYYSRKKREFRERLLRKQYGIGLDEYERLAAEQNGLCAICGCPAIGGKILAVDHDHANGSVRGLLCLNCNNGLGRFKDSAERLEAAARYLRAASSRIP